MRVTQSLEQSQFLAAISALESNLSQTQNQMSSNLSFHHRLAEPHGRGRREQLQAGLGAEPAIRHQRQQCADESEHRGQRAVAGAGLSCNTLRDLALEANSGTLTSAEPRRHRDPGGADSEQPAVARQYPRRQRRIPVRRLRHADAALHIERRRRDVQRRSRSATGADRGRPDGRGRRQRRHGFQSNQDRQRHVCRPRRTRQHRDRRCGRDHGVEPGRL